MSYALGDADHPEVVSLLSGINSGGKTTLLDLIAQIVILAHMGLPVPASSCSLSLVGWPIYLEFLAGQRDLHCTAWTIPTRNIRGWKAPCYLITDGHYAHYQEMLDKVDWNKYGVVRGVVRDPRCENCMVHCGYDPSGALGTNYQRGDTWKNIRYNFGARPKPYYAGREVKAFNGFSIGKGHLAEAKTAINPALAGAKSAFQNNGDAGKPHVGTFCGTGDTSERDALLAKIAKK